MGHLFATTYFRTSKKYLILRMPISAIRQGKRPPNKSKGDRF